MEQNWDALFDELKAPGRFQSDAQLAHYLGLTRAQVSAWRCGKTRLGTLTKIKILDALGHDSVRSMMTSLFPERGRDEALARHSALVARVSAKEPVENERATDGFCDGPCDGPLANLLLARLPATVRERITPHLSTVSLPLGKVLYEPGDRLSHVYLPTTAIISMLYVMENGASAEIAMVGKEGLLGVALFTGGETVPNRALVQSEGEALRLGSDVVKEEFARGGAIQQLFLRYIQALITQMAQTAVCNRHHSIGQQFCRWLLLSLDRLESNDIRMTQELIANMLGVRRAGVTEAARQLQRIGAIRYNRGLITVVNRDAVEDQVCECYHVVKSEEERLFRIWRGV